MIIEMFIISLFSLAFMAARKRRFLLNQINIRIRGEKILILMAAVELTAMFLFRKYDSPLLLFVVSLVWVIYPVILYITGLNIRKHYMKLFFAGTLLNFAAITFNSFKMPVYIPELTQNAGATIEALKAGKDLIHSYMTDATRLKFICDIITIPPPYPFVKTISVGDILLLLGVFVFWQEESSEG